jgi:hypothetical protein
MTQDQINAEISQILQEWQKNYIVAPLDQFSNFQIKNDILQLLLKVRKEDVKCQSKN